MGDYKLLNANRYYISSKWIKKQILKQKIIIVYRYKKYF
jgi:hypothetical protein